MTNWVMKCSDPETFRLTGEWEKAGLETNEQVRDEMLWRFVRGELESGSVAVRGHLSECAECRALAESFRRLNSTLNNRQARVFAVCPEPATLAAYVDNELASDERERVRRHLGECESCRKEVAWLEQPAASEVVEVTRRGWLKWAGAAAAMLVTGSFTWWKLRPSSPYAHLAEIPALDMDNLMQTAASDQKALPMFFAAADAYRRGSYDAARSLADQALAVNAKHSSALLVKGLAVYRTGDLAEAYRLILESESIRPKTDYRCWVALQFALLTGDLTVIRKECQHVYGHERYRQGAERIRGEVDRISKI